MPLKSGEPAEILASKALHSKGIPLLISAVILREIGAGQVDIALIEQKPNQKQVTIYEVKSKSWPSKGQWRRLVRSCEYVSQVLRMSSVIRVWQLEKETFAKT